MKRMRKIFSLLIVMVMLGLSVNVFAEEHTVSTDSDSHTYQIYQIFTGTYDAASGQLQDLKYGTNAKTGTAGESVSAADMAALAGIEANSYANDQERIADLLPFVDLTGDPVAEIGKEKEASASLEEGYYIIKDKDDSLVDPETYTLYLFKVLNDDLVIQPKSGTTTVSKTVTETADATGTTSAGQKGVDYDEGDSIPYSIDITLAENVTSYKTYTVTLTDTLSDGLTPPAEDEITVTLKDKDGNELTDDKYGTPTVEIDGQEITVTYTISCGADEAALGDEFAALNGAVINVSYSAVLNSEAVAGSAGNANTYSITYTNNPNGNDTGTTPDSAVYVYSYDLEINKVDGNEEPLAGAAFTLYKEVTEDHAGAETGEDIKAGLDQKVDASKLQDDKYYVAVEMEENVVTDAVTHKTATSIDAGNYVLIETTVPAGYNAYAGEEITITSTIDAETGKLTGLTVTPNTLNVGSDKAVITGTVENNSGTELPSTGGAGTTLFYVIGAILVIGAGVLLIARRRTDTK